MPTIPVDDLVARLRREASACLSCARTVDAYTAEELANEAALLNEAADRIEAKAAEIARLREALAGIEQHLSAKTDLGWHSDQALRLSRLSPEVSDGPVL